MKKAMKVTTLFAAGFLMAAKRVVTFMAFFMAYLMK